MSKIPAFQFYPADWRKDIGVQSLSFHDRGVWFEILCLMHESEQRGKLLLNGKAMPKETLSRLLGLDKQLLDQALGRITEAGVLSIEESTNALINRRMVKDEYIRQVRKKAGEQGGNPALLNQEDKQKSSKPPSKNQPLQSSSSSSSSEEIKDENVEPNVEAARAPSPRKRGTRIPEPFLLTAEMRTWAAENRGDVDVALETKKFVNHFRAKTGQNATKMDWRGTWENWILNVNGYGQQGKNGYGKNNGYNGTGRRTDADVIEESKEFYRNYGKHST